VGPTCRREKKKKKKKKKKEGPREGCGLRPASGAARAGWAPGTAQWLPFLFFCSFFYSFLFLFFFDNFCKTPSNQFKQNSKFF
jgi:hypothetical protein